MVRAGRGNHLRHRGQRAAQQIRRGSVSSSTTEYTKRMAGFLLVGTILGGWSAPILAQEAATATQAAPTAAGGCAARAGAGYRCYGWNDPVNPRRRLRASRAGDGS